MKKILLLAILACLSVSVCAKDEYKLNVPRLRGLKPKLEKICEEIKKDDVWGRGNPVYHLTLNSLERQLRESERLEFAVWDGFYKNITKDFQDMRLKAQDAQECAKIVYYRGVASALMALKRSIDLKFSADYIRLMSRKGTDRDRSYHLGKIGAVFSYIRR
jgi:hypothetical protein